MTCTPARALPGTSGCRGARRPADLVLDGDGRPIADADRHREASLVDEAVDLLMEVALVRRVDVGDGHLVGQAPAGTFLRVVTVQEDEGVLALLGGSQVGLIRGQQESGSVCGLRGVQVVSYGDRRGDGRLKHRDSPVQQAHRRGEGVPGAFQVGGGEDVGDLLDRAGLEPPAGHAVGLDGGPAGVVVVERAC